MHSIINTLRKQYLEQGYAVLPKLSVSLMDSVQAAMTEAVQARSSKLLYCPRQGDKPEGGGSKDPMRDPFWQDLQKSLQRRRESQATDLRKKKKGSSDVTGLDVFAMAQLIAEQMTTADNNKAKEEPLGAGTTSLGISATTRPRPPIQEDHTLMAAIDDMRCNLWMTHPNVEKLVRSELPSLLGPLVRQVTGMKNPVLFSDRPAYRISYSRPIGAEFAAPHIGVDPAKISKRNSCCLWIMGDDTSALQCPLRVLPNSPHYVQHRYPKVLPLVFNREFIPTEAHMSHCLKHFPDLMAGVADNRSSGSSGGSSTSTTSSLAHVEYVPLQRGDVLLMQPHLMYTLGANYSPDPHCSWQLLLVDPATPSAEVVGGSSCSGNSIPCCGVSPSRVPHSWIKRWHTSLDEVNFGDTRLFPKW